jgi:hypothetical protein
MVASIYMKIKGKLIFLDNFPGNYYNTAEAGAVK